MITYTPCTIEKVQFAEEDKAPYDPVALVDCMFYDPDDEQYKKSGITPEVVKRRIKSFVGKFVTYDHKAAWVHPDRTAGYVVDAFTDEQGKGYAILGIYDKKTAEKLEKKEMGVSAGWLKYLKDGKVADVLGEHITLCEFMKPRAKNAKTGTIIPVAMGEIMDLQQIKEQFAEQGITIYTQEEVDAMIKQKLEEHTKIIQEQFAEEKDKEINEKIEAVKKELFAQFEKEKKIEQICEKFGIEKEVFAKCETVNDVLDVFASLELKSQKNTNIVGASFGEPQNDIDLWARYRGE